MSAQIVDLADFRSKRLAPVTAAVSPLPQTPATAPFQFWSGASGTRYVHSIYNLFECPPLEEANYILVKRHRDGQRTVLSIGRVAHAAPSTNLSTIRQRAAELSANEVHIHLLAGGTDASRQIESDLRRALVIA